jgi:hypothetical protein
MAEMVAFILDHIMQVVAGVAHGLHQQQHLQAGLAAVETVVQTL